VSLGPSGNPTVQGRLAKMEGIARHDLMEDVRVVMATPQGRRLHAHYLKTTHRGVQIGPQAPDAVHYHVGIRDFGVAMEALLLQASPDLYVLMEQERLAALVEEKLHHDDARQNAAAEEANG
jgi:hypothetical protein